MRADIKTRLKEAQADLDAVNRLIAVQKEIDPPPATASVEETRKESIAILEKQGQPMHRTDLLKALEDSDIRVGGKVPVNNLGSILSRFEKDFKPHGQGVWGLKAWHDFGPHSSESKESNGPDTATRRAPLLPTLATIQGNTAAIQGNTAAIQGNAAAIQGSAASIRGAGQER